MDNQFQVGSGSVIIKLQPKIYSLDVIYSAAYVFMDRVYIILDGDPEKEIIVKLKAKKSEDMEKLSGEFYNELVNYSVYKKQVEKNSGIRQMIVERALLTNMAPAREPEEEKIIKMEKSENEVKTE
jgi:His-Xaa-Ser system protein HxsD